MNAFLAASVEANREIISTYANTHLDVLAREHKIGAGGDVSLEADLIAEDIFVKHLAEFGRIDSEESGLIGAGESRIVIDPLDGSANFISRLPYYGSSVALIGPNGMLENAMVCNFASREIVYKDGSLLTGDLYSNDHCAVVKNTHASIGIFERAYDHPDICAELKEHNMKFRSSGATALSLAYAHNVRFVLFVGKIRMYDVVAGLSFCEDLEVVVDDEYVIVAQEKSILQEIEQIVKRNKR